MTPSSEHKSVRRAVTISRRRLQLLLVLTGLVGVLVAFVGAFGLHRFADDWAFVYRASQGNLIGFMFEPFYQHWSPLWHLTEAVNFWLAGWNSDWFIRGFILMTRVLSYFVAWRAIRWMGFGTLGAIATIGVLGLHHAQGITIYSYDTFSQSATDLLGWAGALLFWRSLRLESPLRSKPYRNALIFLTLALLYKEQGMAAAGTCIVFAFVYYAQFDNWKAWWQKVLRAGLPVVGIVVTFVLARALAGRFFQPRGRFSLSIPSIPKNMVQLSLGLVSPVRTLEWFDALTADPVQMVRVAILIAVTLVCVGLILAGASVRMRLSLESRRHFWMLVGAVVISMFPVSLMSKVAEAYIHSLLFWFALLVGYSVDGWSVRVGSRSRIGRPILAACVLVYLMSLGYALRSNLREMQATSNRAETWFNRMENALLSVPAGSRVLIYNHLPERLKSDYSLYRATTPHAFMLRGMANYSLRYLTDSKVHFRQADDHVAPELIADSLRATEGSPVFEMHIRDEEIQVSRLE